MSTGTSEKHSFGMGVHVCDGQDCDKRSDEKARASEVLIMLGSRMFTLVSTRALLCWSAMTKKQHSRLVMSLRIDVVWHTRSAMHRI